MELPKKLEPSEKYPNENCSVVLGECYGAKITTEIVCRYNSHDDLLAACKRAKEAVYAAINGNKSKLSHAWHDLEQAIAAV